MESEKVTARRAQQYPMSAEREYARVLLAYNNMLIKDMKPRVKKIMDRYEVEIDDNFREDDFSSFRKMLYDELMDLASDFSKSFKGFGITKLLEKCAKVAKTHSIKDWLKLVKDTVGVEVSNGYYEELLEETKRMWVQDNVSYIKSVPEEYLNDLRDTILWAYDTKQPMVNLYRRLEKKFGMDKKRAKVIARDQIGTLNYQMMRKEQESMGCTHYIWKTRKDARVRECHRQLEGTIHSWSDPPEMWYMTKGRGIVYTGRHCHPSEDYMCRCTAVPIFDKGKVRAVIEKEEK